MYHSHFGLRESPFNITPNPAFFYAGNTRGDILEAMLYAVSHGEGIIKVTGEVGAGKTMLCRMLESRMPSHIDVIYLVQPNLDPLEVQHAIAAELGLTTHGQRADEVQRSLQAELIARHGAGRQVVLLVEEAQDREDSTLAARRGQAGGLGAQRGRRDAIQVGKPDVGQRGGELERQVQLGRRAEPHRGAGVDQQIDRQILVLFVAAQREPPQAPVEVPVEVSEIVAGGVVAVIGELEARAQAPAAAPAAALAGGGPAGGQAQGLEPPQEPLVEAAAQRSRTADSRSLTETLLPSPRRRVSQ